jgi:hypothetical protein
MLNLEVRLKKRMACKSDRASEIKNQPQIEAMTKAQFILLSFHVVTSPAITSTINYGFSNRSFKTKPL